MVETAKTKPGFEHLFNQEERVAQMHDREVETILMDVCEEDRKNQYARKLTLIQTRNLDQDAHAKTNAEKVATYLTKTGIFMDCCSLLLSVGSAYTGGQTTMAGGLFGVAAQAFSKTSEHNKDYTHSEQSKIEHKYNRIGANISEEREQIQQAERDNDRNASKLEQSLDKTQRLFEMILSS